MRRQRHYNSHHHFVDLDEVLVSLEDCSIAAVELLTTELTKQADAGHELPGLTAGLAEEVQGTVQVLVELEQAHRARMHRCRNTARALIDAAQKLERASK